MWISGASSVFLGTQSVPAGYREGHGTWCSANLPNRDGHLSASFRTDVPRDAWLGKAALLDSCSSNPELRSELKGLRACRQPATEQLLHTRALSLGVNSDHLHYTGEAHKGGGVRMLHCTHHHRGVGKPPKPLLSTPHIRNELAPASGNKQGTLFSLSKGPCFHFLLQPAGQEPQ